MRAKEIDFVDEEGNDEVVEKKTLRGRKADEVVADCDLKKAKIGGIDRFYIHDVAVGPQLPPVRSDSLKNAWGKVGELLVCSEVGDDLPCVELFDSPNLLAASVYKAFYRHYPVKINPCSVWLTICQGFAQYVEVNAEALRSKFVSFDGKQSLTIARSDFVRDYTKNPWEEVFPEFVKQITSFVGSPTTELLDCNFSNSTPLDKVAAHITIMDIMKNYFDYGMMCGCGIPYIELLGTPADWVLIRKKAEALGAYTVPQDSTIKEWLVDLLPVLDHFVAAAHGNPDIAFWGSVCNVLGVGMYEGMWKGDPVTGWMQVFFPYADAAAAMSSKPVRNRSLSKWRVAYAMAKKYGVEKVLANAQVPKVFSKKAFAEEGFTEEGLPRRSREEEKEEEEREKEKGVEKEKKEVETFVSGMELKDIPTGLSSAPVTITWADGAEPAQEEVRFYAGLVSMHQHPDGALEVRTGWGVVKKGRRRQMGWFGFDWVKK